MSVLRPSVSFTYYHPVQKRRNVIGFRVLGSFLTGYGGRVAPPYERFYIGEPMFVASFYSRSADMSEGQVLLDELVAEGMQELDRRRGSSVTA